MKESNFWTVFDALHDAIKNDDQIEMRKCLVCGSNQIDETGCYSCSFKLKQEKLENEN